MIIGRVTGNIVSTIKHPSHKGLKLMKVQPLGWDGQDEGGEIIAADCAYAGVDDVVLCSTEGGASRTMLSPDGSIIVDAVIAGIID